MRLSDRSLSEEKAIAEFPTPKVQPKLRSTVPAEQAGKRLDAVLPELFPGYSRSRLQRWVREGHVLMDAAVPECSDKVRSGAKVEIDPPEPLEARWEAESLPLEIRYEDDAILVVNKAAGMVVHPGAGNPAGTMLNALLHHVPGLAAVPRAGIVHRLDKDTSGLVVVAKSDAIRLRLIGDLQARRVKREYLAVVNGILQQNGVVNAPIGRHPTQRTRMAVRPRGKIAVSHYRIEAVYAAHTLLAVRLESGRTHQIRVHMAYIGHPVLGDPVYGSRHKAGKNWPAIAREFPRQALHAVRLGLQHPLSQQPMEWSAPLPAEMQELIEALAGC